MFFNLVDLCSDCELMQRNKELEEENIKLKNELEKHGHEVYIFTTTDPNADKIEKDVDIKYLYYEFTVSN